LRVVEDMRMPVEERWTVATGLRPQGIREVNVLEAVVAEGLVLAVYRSDLATLLS
jgi:hypothetical protein